MMLIGQIVDVYWEYQYHTVIYTKPDPTETPIETDYFRFQLRL